MKFLITGIGSIGQRHYRNLQSLGHEMALYRTSKNQRPFVKKFFQEQRKKGINVKVYYNLQEAFRDFKPDAVFITNPNHLHIKIAMATARAGIDMFIEKPIFHELKDIKKFTDLVKKNKLKVLVGYNLRYHPLLIKMKTIYDQGNVGKLLSAEVEVGENIIDWHPWEDYQDTYAPYKKSGGGVLLCFSHDIDYVYWILGKPKKIQSWGGKVTPLAGDGEDMVKSVWEYDNKATVSLHLDYWQRPKVRFFKLIGTKGSLVWDYEAGELNFTNNKTKQTKVFKVSKKFDRNDMFISEAKNFINMLKGKAKPQVPHYEAVEILRIIAVIKDQLK